MARKEKEYTVIIEGVWTREHTKRIRSAIARANGARLIDKRSPEVTRKVVEE